MKPYQIVIAKDVPSLMTDVNAAIENGYTPTGGIMYDVFLGGETIQRPAFMQAMYKKPKRVVKKRASKHSEYPEWFEAAWSYYPKRAGSNPKRKAMAAATARLAEDESLFEDMLPTRAKMYAHFCDETGITGTSYVLQAATFFGPDKRYEEDWSLPTNTETLPRDNDQLVNWATQKGYRAPRPGETFPEYRRAVEALYRNDC